MAQRRTSAPKKQTPRKKTPSANGRISSSAALPLQATPGVQSEVVEKAVPEVESVVEEVPAVVAIEEALETSIEQGESDESVTDLQAAAPVQPPTSVRRRVLDVFLVDSGWNNPVCDAVRENLPAIHAYLKDHRFFVLNHEQSKSFIQGHAALIGADPILIVLDREAAAQRNSAGWGFRLCLGHVRQPEVAISMLKWAIQLTMAASATEMANLVRKSGHRETVQGVIELIGEGSTHLLEFAPV